MRIIVNFVDRRRGPDINEQSPEKTLTRVTVKTKVAGAAVRNHTIFTVVQRPSD